MDQHETEWANAIRAVETSFYYTLYPAFEQFLAGSTKNENLALWLKK